MDAPAGTYIAFATAPGRTAADGAGAHGLYTQNLLAQLAVPGTKVEDVFKRVRAGVMEASSGQQVPWESSSLTGDFYFAGGAAPAAPAPTPAVDLLGKVLEARGGLQAMRALKAIAVRGMEAPDGKTFVPFVADQRRDGAFYSEVSDGETVTILVSDGLRTTSTSMKMDKTGVLTPPAYLGEDDAKAFRGESLLFDPMVLCAEGMGRTEALADAVFEGAPVHQLRVQALGKPEQIYRIDPVTYLPVGYHVRMPMGEGFFEADMRLGDYRKVGALRIPFQLDLFDTTQKKWTPKGRFSEVTLDPEFPADRFKLPHVEEPVVIPAEKVDPVAQGFFEEGARFEEGDGRPMDMAKAVEQYAKAAEMGHARATDALGQVYGRRGEMEDQARAASYYLAAAELGWLPSMVETGRRLEKGNGVVKNLAGAASWYQKAADRDERTAMWLLGTLYRSGRGVERDLAQAFKWFQKSAAHFSPEGEHDLGLAYLNGEGVEKDAEMAASLFREAAGGQNLPAMNRLGLMSETGEGVPKDRKAAIAWYRKAAQFGDADAKQALKRLKAK
jgi:TPR repeat protein